MIYTPYLLQVVLKVSDFLSLLLLYLKKKIKYSQISNKEIIEKLEYLETVQVPNRDVLLSAPDEEVTSLWFKNWLHPRLYHFLKEIKPVFTIEEYAHNSLRFYENRQFNYNYSLNDIREYVGLPTK